MKIYKLQGKGDTTKKEKLQQGQDFSKRYVIRNLPD